MADICNRQCWERLIILETAMKERFEANKLALELAKMTHDRDRIEASHALDVKMEGYNQWQHRFNKLEGALVRKDDLEKEVKTAREHTDLLASNNLMKIEELAKLSAFKHETLLRLVYIGVGIVATLQFVMHYWVTK